MTTRTLAALLVSTCLSAPAFAADLPVKAPRAATPVVADWTGFYLGIHGGYGWAQTSVDEFGRDFLSEFGFHEPEPKGAVFGGQAGYNWQRGNFVGGIEIDYSFADLKETQSFSETFVPDIHVDAVAPAPVTTTWSLHTKVDALASARARAGFLIGPDFYIYGTGGIGWARSKANVDRDRCIGGECLNVFAASAVENNFGWVAGAGAEYRLWQNVSLGVTYLHYDFGSTNYAFSVAERPITFSVKSDLTVDVVRGALNFRF